MSIVYRYWRNKNKPPKTSDEGTIMTLMGDRDVVSTLNDGILHATYYPCIAFG